MKHLILIDRSTIRENPNAGRTRFPIPGRVTSILIYCSPVLAIPYGLESATITSYNTYDPLCFEITALLGDTPQNLPEIMEEDGFPKDHWRLNSHQDIQYIESFYPEPKMLYGYEDTFVECDYCHTRFSYQDLGFKDNCDAEDEDYIYSDCVCPHCGVWYCCDYEFEKLEDVK